MEPVEINAGTWYLRALRWDDRVDDRPAVLAGFRDPETRRWLTHIPMASLDDAGAYVRRRAAEWAADTGCSWAVAEPTTGDLLGEIVLKDLDLQAHTAEAGCWMHPASRGRGVAVTALSAALRFGFGALGLERVRYQHDELNTASRRVAEKCGMQLSGEKLPPGRRPDGTLHQDLLWHATPG